MREDFLIHFVSSEAYNKEEEAVQLATRTCARGRTDERCATRVHWVDGMCCEKLDGLRGHLGGLAPTYLL